MRLDPDKPLVGDFASLVSGDFASSLPSVSILQKAWASPAASFLASDGELGTALAENGVRAFRFVAARTGVDVGVPLNVLGDFTRAISIAGSDQAVQGWLDFVSSATDAIIDIACEAIGAVPFVGWLAKGIKSILDLIAQRLAQSKPKPAMLMYDKADDEQIATVALKKLRALDWTFMFMPPYSPGGWGDWEIVEQNEGWLMRPKFKFKVESHFVGAVPGGPLGSQGVQSRNCWAGMPSLTAPKPGGMGGEESNLDKLLRTYKSDYRDATDCIVDIYETTPSLTRVALSSWQQMTAGKTATLFQVDTRGIADAWEAYVSTAIEASRVNSSGAVSEFGGPRWVAWKNLEAAMYARGWNTGEEQDGPKRTATLDDLAARYAADLRKRQRAALDTLLVAYAQEGQGAFRDPAMRELLTTRRSQLLTDGDRWKVDPDDILDADFRSAFRESIRNIGDRPLRLGESGGRPRRAVPGALPMPTPDNVGDGEGGGGGGAAVAVVAGLLGLGLIARRRVLRRR